MNDEFDPREPWDAGIADLLDAERSAPGPSRHRQDAVLMAVAASVGVPMLAAGAAGGAGAAAAGAASGTSAAAASGTAAATGTAAGTTSAAAATAGSAGAAAATAGSAGVASAAGTAALAGASAAKVGVLAGALKPLLLVGGAVAGLSGGAYMLSPAAPPAVVAPAVVTPAVQPAQPALPAVAPAAVQPEPVVQPARPAVRARPARRVKPRATPVTAPSAPAAPAASVTAPTAASTAAAPAVPSERALLEKAKAALGRSDPRAALAALATHQRVYPTGALAEERAVLRILALQNAGRSAEAERAASRFMSRFPSSLFGPAVRDALAGTH